MPRVAAGGSPQGKDAAHPAAEILVVLCCLGLPGPPVSCIETLHARSTRWLLSSWWDPDRSTKSGQRRLNSVLGPSHIFISKLNVRSHVI